MMQVLMENRFTRISLSNERTNTQKNELNRTLRKGAAVHPTSLHGARFQCAPVLPVIHTLQCTFRLHSAAVPQWCKRCNSVFFECTRAWTQCTRSWRRSSPDWHRFRRLRRLAQWNRATRAPEMTTTSAASVQLQLLVVLPQKLKSPFSKWKQILFSSFFPKIAGEKTGWATIRNWINLVGVCFGRLSFKAHYVICTLRNIHLFRERYVCSCGGCWAHF